MSILHDEFAKGTEKLREHPGLPGVYTSNPQTLLTLNVGMASPEVNSSPII